MALAVAREGQQMSISGRDPATENNSRAPEESADEALQLMERALHIIDHVQGPEDAGAYLDLAIHRLREWIDNPPAK